MPRTGRQAGATGIYHVILRGIDRQLLFEEPADYYMFLNQLDKTAETTRHALLAYCLMDNHVHLLIREQDEPLALIMKRVGIRYATAFNKKYERTGHLFQDRYHSEPVDNDAYLLTVIRYICRNPIKAGLTDRLDNYPYSSWNEMCKGESVHIDTDMLFELVALDRIKAYCLTEQDSTPVFDIPDRKKFVTDDEALVMIRESFGCKSASECRQLSLDQRKELVRFLSDNGVSFRGISRLTGFSLGTVSRYNT